MGQTWYLMTLTYEEGNGVTHAAQQHIIWATCVTHANECRASRSGRRGQRKAAAERHTAAVRTWCDWCELDDEGCGHLVVQEGTDPWARQGHPRVLGGHRPHTRTLQPEQGMVLCHEQTWWLSDVNACG
jgi:hypothetical protein